MDTSLVEFFETHLDVLRVLMAISEASEEGKFGSAKRKRRIGGSEQRRESVIRICRKLCGRMKVLGTFIKSP